MEPILYVPPKIKGFRLSVLSIAVSWILLSVSYLTYAFNGSKPNYWIADFATVAFLLAICTFQQKGLVELALFSISLGIFVTLAIVQTGLHYNWLIEQIKLPPCEADATTPATIFGKTTCSDYRWDAGGWFLFSLLMDPYSVTALYIIQSVSLALTLLITPVVYFLNIKLFIHRWAMRKVIILSPVPNIFGKCVAVQTDPIEDEEEQETGQVIEEEDEGIDVDGSVAI